MPRVGQNKVWQVLPAARNSTLLISVFATYFSFSPYACNLVMGNENSESEFNINLKVI